MYHLFSVTSSFELKTQFTLGGFALSSSKLDWDHMTQEESDKMWNYQDEHGGDETPTNTPVDARTEAEHWLDVVREPVHTCAQIEMEDLQGYEQNRNGGF